MQRKNLFLLMAMFLCISFLQAQRATLSGKITDRETGEPLIAATVLVGAKGVVSDIDGAYTLQLAPGTYKVEISYVGYQTFLQTVDLQSNETKTLDAALTTETNILQTATVTSGKYEKPLSEVTVSLEVLKPNLIENTSKLTIDKALDKVPGVSVIDGQANIRGGSGYSYGAGSRVLLMVDDIPILQADAGFPNWDDVPVENIEQVEIVKGAASSLYGSSALNGIINIRTAIPKSEPETKVAAFYTYFMDPRREQLKWWDSAPYTLGGSISHRQKFKKLDLVAGAYYLKEESFNRDTYKEFGRFNFTTNYRITDRFAVGVNANFNKGKTGSFFYWQTDTSAYVGTPSTLSNRERFRYNIDPHITYFDKSGNRHKVLGRFYNVDNDNDSNQSNHSEILYGEYQFQRRFVEWDLVLTAGIVGQYSEVIAELYGDTTFSARNLATYIQLEKRLLDRFNISAGFRYENNRLSNPGFTSLGVKVEPSEEKESQPVFRLGVNYRAADFTYIRASWGQGYRYPTIAEKFIVTDVGGFFVVPSPFVGSETGWTAEIGIKQGFKLASFQGFLDIAAFQMSFSDMIEFNLVRSQQFALPVFQATNIGGTEIKGFEVSVAGRGRMFGNWESGLLAGYTYIDPRYEEFDATPAAPGETPSQGQINHNNSSFKSDNILKYRPRHNFKLDFELKNGPFAVGLESFHSSNVEAIDAVFLLIIRGLQKYRANDDDGYWLHNVRTSYTFAKDLKVSLLLNNIFNEEYTLRPGLLEAPRNLTMRLDYKF